MKAVLTALATANPKRYASQQEVYSFLESHFPMEQSERELYRELLLNGPIRGRHIAVDADEEICSQDPDYLIGRFARHGRQIAAEAARAALDQAGLKPSEIEGLVVNTCTGYLCPGLSSYLVEDLGLPAFTSVLDLMGMGCGGAIPNLEAACRMIQSGARRTVLCLSVEICSATFFLGPDPDLIVSNSIFADGASAAVLQANLNGDPAVRIQTDPCQAEVLAAPPLSPAGPSQTLETGAFLLPAETARHVVRPGPQSIPYRRLKDSRELHRGVRAVSVLPPVLPRLPVLRGHRGRGGDD